MVGEWRRGRSCERVDGVLWFGVGGCGGEEGAFLFFGKRLEYVCFGWEEVGR